jgi:hypothetical protein
MHAPAIHRPFSALPRRLGVFVCLTAASIGVFPGAARAQVASGPLTVHPTNPRYFADASGKAVYLTGSHTWSSLQEEYSDSFNVTFDFNAYLDFLEEHNHNFIRLWRAEFPQYAYPNDTEYRYSSPHPWMIVGGDSGGGGESSEGSDGSGGSGPGGLGGGKHGGGSGPGAGQSGEGGGFGTKTSTGEGGGIASISPALYDLSQFNPEFFDRLRTRCIAAGQRGMYVSVMLFEGHAINNTEEGWNWHPFKASNNINGVNGDPNGDGQGREINTLDVPAVTAAQEAYVRKVIDTVNDLDNVMFEIANESSGDSVAWQNHFIDYIHAYEAGKPKQHPVYFTTPLANVGNALWDSNAEAIAPGTYSNNGAYQSNPPANDGNKVIITDTDHLFGCGGSSEWVWKSFTRGLNPIYMDPYYDSSPFCPPPNEAIRDSMGHTRLYALQMDMDNTVPRGDLASTTYCLANIGTTYFVYAPTGGNVTVNLSGVSGTIHREWFNPTTATFYPIASVQGGGNQTFNPPFSGPSVLFLFKNTTDLNGDGVVDIGDLLLMLTQWGPCQSGDPCVPDLNEDGTIAIDDLLTLLSEWG